MLSRGRRGPQKGLGDSTSSQAAPSSWPGDSVADTCSVPPASYSLTDHLQREASAPALPRFNKITLYLQITLPSPPPPSKTSCFTPTPVLLRIFLVRHLRSLPIRCPMYNQTFSVGFFFLYIYIYKWRRHLPQAPNAAVRWLLPVHSPPLVARHVFAELRSTLNGGDVTRLFL